MDEKTKQRIMEEETKKFLDEGFGQLDLSSYPDLEKPVTDTFESEDKHGLNRVDTSGLGGANRLKDLVRNPDAAALSELARENPDLAEKLQSDNADLIARQFRMRNADFVNSAFNQDQILRYLLEKHVRQDLKDFNRQKDAIMALMSVNAWTVAELETAYQELLRRGELAVLANQPRNLTDTEKLHVEQMAANGLILEALVEYVKARVGEDVADQVTFNLIDPAAFASDPANRPIFEESAWFVWQAARPEFSPTPERIARMKEHIAGRFVTIALLDAAWRAVQTAEKDALRSGLLNGPAESSENVQRSEEMNFDNLSDEEIARLKTATLHEYARQQRPRR